MKFISLILSFLAFLIVAKAQSDNITIGKTDTIHSFLLNENRPLWIYIPENAIENENDQKKYPVVYLLDGDWHFVSVVGMLQQLSYINGNTICPEMIVVGIPVKDRYRDLTPTHDPNYSETSGGYTNFISFIKDELMPYIDSTYPTAPYNMFVGHSLGGLTVLKTLTEFPELFNAYVAIDPSMWWDNQHLLNETKTTFPKFKHKNNRLYLAIANTMDKGMDTSIVRNDKTRNTLSIRSLLEFADVLKTTDLKHQTKYYHNENHGSIPMIATYDALHFVFDFYNLPLTKSDYADTTMALANRIENHYRVVSENMGYKIEASESMINTLAYTSLYMNNLKLAEHFFKLNVLNYPNSYNAYDSMGDYYMAIKKKDKAIEMYRKSLSIHENSDTRKKIDAIQ